MIPDILTLYFLGLTTLLLSYFLGLVLFRFRKANLFLSLLLGYLLLIASYAVVKGGGNSIGVFVLIWVFGYLIYIRKEENQNQISCIAYLKNIGIISSLWTMIFVLKASWFWNFEYNAPNLLFVDNGFYMKIAEGYHLSGNENAIGLKNALFPYLNFAQPYRTNDFWLVSLGLDLTKIDTIYIWELFYSTIIIFICSLSLFELLRQKFKLLGSLVLSVLLLFAFSGQWYRDLSDLIYPNHSGGYDPVGILAYTKLAIIFSIYFQFFLKFEKGKKEEAIYLLLLIPFLVQSTIALFLVVFSIILFCLFQEKNEFKKSLNNYKTLIGFFIILTIAFVFFYYFNQQKEQLYIGNSNLAVSNTISVIDFIIQILKKTTLLFIAYYWLSFLLVSVLLWNTKSLPTALRKSLFVFLVLCYFSSILVYVKFNKIGDAYQFATNVFGPFVLSLMLYLFMQTSVNILLGKIKLSLLIIISVLGAQELIGGNNFFHSTTRIKYYDKGFIKEAKNQLSKLEYPFGLVYYGADLQNHSKEDYPQHDAAFLKLFGRNYTVFNIEADSLKMELLDQSNQKRNVFIQGNALNIWLHNSNRLSKTNKKLTRRDFYDAYPFSFCISKKSKDSLPDFIQSDVVITIKDRNSKIYFYILDRKKQIK
ncbi:hypothetical protein [Flavobacterium sp.]|uniref:hypothetical protein n=1 Tax=Flavobacterium sp. TaxID=239 RepID=UPI0025C4D88D|nr:hypothetical protein [Flavobacterium sp.]MBA4277617.1 hypothetical protein [Flavobacterium sp.]